MSRQFTAAALIVMTVVCAAVAETTVTVVARPANSTVNQHYVGNREPLLPGVLTRLPLGSIRPDGWLHECMRRQRDGLVGQLQEVSAWLQRDGNAWLSKDGRGKWGWEEVPYWLRGFHSMSRQLGDEEMLRESRVWIEAAVKGQRPDGNFGPLRVFGDDDSQDFWGNMVMLSCLQDYFEYSDDPRVLELMSEYFRMQLAVPDEKFLTHFWQYYRGGDNLQNVYWLYNRTGDKWLLDLARKIHANTANWRIQDDLPNWHGVNIAQGFHEPAVFYRQSHDPGDLLAARRNFDLIRERFGQMPGGMFAADENAREGYSDPRQGVETCAVIEQMLSDQSQLQTTGDVFWADHLEDVAFNTLPATMMPDCRSLRYLTSPNQVRSDRQNHAPGIENIGPMLVMNPLSHRCCQHNASSSWTSVVQSLWMATADNGLCACVYGPGTVKALVADGITATIREETHYPFEEQIQFVVSVDQPVRFPIYLRTPGWCSKSEILVNRVSVADNLSPGKFVKIDRLWKGKDAVTLKLPMPIQLRRWRHNQSLSVDRGPLTYSLKIGEHQVRCDPIATAAQDSQWREDVDVAKWPAFEILPTTAWNYGLLLNDSHPEQSFHVEQQEWPLDDFPFTADGTPVSMTVAARRIPDWKVDLTGLCGRLQPGPIYVDQANEKVRLIPMGAARLRISAFPEVRDDKNLRPWITDVPRGIAYQPSASFCNPTDRIRAIVDGREPCASNDRGIERMSFLPHVGTEEWLQATFKEPIDVGKVAIYWCDDESRYDHAPTGMFDSVLPPANKCRVPLSWQLFYLADSGSDAPASNRWLPVVTDGAYGVGVDRYNVLRFKRVTTSALRIAVQLRERASAGVLEWYVGGADDSPSD